MPRALPPAATERASGLGRQWHERLSSLEDDVLMAEVGLPGGYVTGPVRLGNTVRRRHGARAEFVHRLLQLFEGADWPGAPRFLGFDADGREMLSYVGGHAAWEARQPSGVTSRASLRRVGELVREFHELTAGTDLADCHEVVCHNDLSPRNTIYRDSGTGLRPVAFIDWDLAAPGRRIHDVAQVCWQFLNLGPDVEDVATTAALMQVICDGYGPIDLSELVPTILWWQDRCWRGISDGAKAGDPAMLSLRDGGAIVEVTAAYRWTQQHRAALDPTGTC
jgi:tRNA A-37 threonylcarbamoyl transferase component Bud32